MKHASVQLREVEEGQGKGSMTGIAVDEVAPMVVLDGKEHVAFQELERVRHCLLLYFEINSDLHKYWKSHGQSTYAPFTCLLCSENCTAVIHTRSQHHCSTVAVR